MTLSEISLLQSTDTPSLSFSIYRLWDHLYFYQVNPFKAIGKYSHTKPEHFIDIMDDASHHKVITGITLGDLYDSGVTLDTFYVKETNSLHKPNSKRFHQPSTIQDVKLWIINIGHHIKAHSEKKMIRNMPRPFIPKDAATPLGLKGLHSALSDWSLKHKEDKATAKQWLKRIQNLAKKGLREDEAVMSRLKENLRNVNEKEPNKKLLGSDIYAHALSYSDLRINLVPMVKKSTNHLDFVRVSQKSSLKRIKPKIDNRIQIMPEWHDRVLGYWIDHVIWNDMLPNQKRWMVFDHRGNPLTSQKNPTGLCESLSKANDLAHLYAERDYPKVSTVGNWSAYRLTGGQNYREWLVTLPYYKHNFYSEHFDLRNVFIHIRCDIRENKKRRKVLFIQELQSDWAQDVRKGLSLDEDGIPTTPPWFKEWTSLGMKLMLLHAVNLNVDALVWTPGYIQMDRYQEHAELGLKRLYDHTLPFEANKILRPYKRKCERVEVYQPKNYYIEPIESGYEVFDKYKRFLGKAKTWKDTKVLFPKGACEVLMQMPGIMLDDNLKKQILKNGFYAWGNGIN